MALICRGSRTAIGLQVSEQPVVGVHIVAYAVCPFRIHFAVRMPVFSNDHVPGQRERAVQQFPPLLVNALVYLRAVLLSRLNSTTSK